MSGLGRGFVHAKLRLIRPRIPTVHDVAGIVADPVLRDQILSTIDPPIDFAELCRDIDPAAFARLAARCVPEPSPLDQLVVDLPEMMAVQRVFFAEANVDVSRVRFHSVLDLDAGHPPAAELRETRWALAVSTWGLSEATASFQDWVAETLFVNAATVYLVGHSTFHGHNVPAYLRSLLASRFMVNDRPFVFTGHGIPSFELFGAALQ